MSDWWRTEAVTLQRTFEYYVVDGRDIMTDHDDHLESLGRDEFTVSRQGLHTLRTAANASRRGAVFHRSPYAVLGDSLLG